MTVMNRALRAAVMLLVLLLAAAPTAAQDFALLEQASAAEEADQYEEAARLYARALATGGETTDLAPAIHKAAASNFAQAEEADLAFEHLRAALNEDATLWPQIKEADAFQKLHGDPRWSDLAATADAQSASINAELRAELLAMEEKDQAVRNALIDAGMAPDSSLVARVQAVDAANRARLKGIIDAHGWPGRSLAGRDGAAAAFLIVQHADADLAFQKRALALLKEAYANGEAAGGDVAMLTDRVRKAEGKKQLYGTQTSTEDSTIVFDSIEDPAQLDERRAEVGLPPLEQYAKMLGEMYKMDVQMP